MVLLVDGLGKRKKNNMNDEDQRKPLACRKYRRALVSLASAWLATALGAAWLAGQRAGIYPDRAAFAQTWALEHQFTPSMSAQTRDAKYARWQSAVQATMAF